MNKPITLLFALLTISNISAQMTVSGTLDSTVSLKAGAGDAPAFSYGIEEYANIRFQTKLQDKGTIYGAVNLIAAAGDYAATAAMMAGFASQTAPGISPTAYVAGENYIAGIELERLYFKLKGEYTDMDAGLFRLPFGYGQVWGPSDFLNPKNPLKPDARLRGILGASLSWYPNDDLKLLAFSAAGRDPFLEDGDGMFAGISMDQHWRKVSMQALYSFQTPMTGSEFGIHRAGLSIKADVEVGLVMDALYTYNHEAETREDGLSFSAGADYSFFGGKLIVLAEYLYNGKTSSTAAGYGGGFSNNHYLYTGFTWIIDDFTNLNAALISGLDDISFTPVISLSHDLFQGAVLAITAQVPMDRDLFSGNGKRGELGPLPPDELQPLKDLIGRRGSYFNFSAALKLKF
ncbi:MAG: hypothetical protein FWC03_11030 [Treponema sp.]|nr:hypothetical protein [Treponema sp.]